MKVDRTKLKKSSSEVPAECKVLIDKLKGLNEDELYRELWEIKVWTYGKCELYHWADVLDIFDSILEKACAKESEKKWTLNCDLPGRENQKRLLLEILRFTALLIEHSFSRHLYNSMDHLITLLTSCDMSTVLYVLNLLYVFSKRSNFISRMNAEKKQGLIQRLIHLAESWGGKENGFGLAECCQDLTQGSFPSSATTLHFEFYSETKDDKNNRKTTVGSSNVIQSIHMENVDKTGKMPSQIMEDVMEVYDVPQEKQVLLFTHIRLACLFSDYEARVHCVQARLQAISILVYSSAIQDNMNVILYPGLIEELVDIVEIKDSALVDIKSAALRTLTSVIHIERNPRWNSIIDATGASSYHGFLPVLVRTCIQHMIDPELKPFPQTYATSLFSFLYHLASYENGVEALVSCGMMESLLKVINWYGDGQEHITFVTRAVRVIDLITNMDMAAFQALGGLQAFINRLEHEVNICRQEQPFVIRPVNRPGESGLDQMPDSPLVTPMDVSMDQSINEGTESEPTADQQTSSSGYITEPTAPTQEDDPGQSAGDSVPLDKIKEGVNKEEPSGSEGDKKNGHCFAQRAALLKSMLNFMKKAIPDLAFAESIRHLMDGSLPKSLKHIISNAEYYGPSLFLLATDVVTVYVFQEPSLLSSLQDKGLTDVVLHALLIKDVPATREVLASLPNVFSALCLNARGLAAFVACRPFDRLFKVLLSPDYLPAMRRRRSSDPFGDTASNLGNAMDELMRHQPSLRTDATKAIIKLLEEICSMGQDPRYICQKQQPKNDASAGAGAAGGQVSNGRSPQSNEVSSSDEEDEEEMEMSHMPPSITASVHVPGGSSTSTQGAAAGTASGAGGKGAEGSQRDSMQSQERQAIPLIDYVLNVMKFVEAILSNNSTDDHCREFVAQNGLEPLMGILGLANLPTDFPSSPACQAVSSVCKSILTLSREPKVLKQGLLQMHEVLQKLQPLHQPLDPPGGSVLLHELAHCAHTGVDATLSPSATPLLHALAAAHAYIMMFVHVCRMGQADIRTISVNSWGSDLGLGVLKGLSSLYNSLVWESTVLLALCNEDYLPADCPFGRADLDKLLSKDVKEKAEAESSSGQTSTPSGGATNTSGINRTSGETGSNGVSVAMETLTTGEEGMDTSEPGAVPTGGAEMEGGLNPTDAGTPNSTSSLDADILPGPSSTGAATTSGALSDDVKELKKKLSPAMQAQLRQLKPLLTLSSRLGRALSELFVLLVKLCVGSPVRQRRSQQPLPNPPVPSPAARSVALALTKLLAGGLSFQPPPCAPQPKLRMTFLVCSAGFTAPLLFDEKKQPYHLMLQKFVACGGQAALFQAFSWALSIDGKVPLSEGLEHPDLPEGTGEFLDSWLALVEKVINPKAVLESPHTLPPKNKAAGLTPFNPVQYLISTQKAAFNAVMSLWNKKPLPVYGSRMSESVLAILCHIIYGEAIIKKHLEKEKAAVASGSGDTAVDLSSQGTSGLSSGASGSGAGPASTASAPPRRPIEPAVNQQHLQQLMDMGFSREQATVALTNTNSLEQATDYILSNPIPPTAAVMQGDMELEFNDVDQMWRAIAMSLGENAIVSTDQPKPDGKEEKTEDEAEEKQEAEEPLDSAVLDDFTMNIFPGCLKLLDTLPETVYRVCDLLIVVIQRNGDKWQRETLGSLCHDLCKLCDQMMEEAQVMNVQAMHTSPNAQKFATMLHLLCLLAEEMNLACALAMERVGLPQKLVRLLQVSKDAILSASANVQANSDKETKPTPKWLAHILLLLDLWEKVSVALKRKMQARITVGPQRIWKWFDDSSGRWCKYSTNNNTTIDEAYKKGDSFVRFQAGRRKYSVQFNSMIQLNEETGNRRPVMLSVPTAEEKGKGQNSQTDDQLIEEIKKEFEAPQNIDDYLPGLSGDNIEVIISCLSAYLSIPLDSDTLHAAMRLILRVTRQHQYAVRFVSEGGARRLLSLTQESNFLGFLNLATLIFRHILEEPASLRYCMVKVMRNVCAGMGSCQFGVSQGGEGAKEMHYVLRVLGPAACRDPQTFVQVARDTLQISLPPAAIRDEDEARYLGPNAPQILKCTPTKQLESLVNPSIKTFLWDLLNALIAQNPTRNVKECESSDDKGPNTIGDLIERAVITGDTASSHFSWVGQEVATTAASGAVSGDQSQTATESAQQSGDKSSESDESAANAASSARQQKPLIPKSAILRLLSEIIRSYGNCVQLITQYNYLPGQTELVPEGCSVLAFVLDRLLPSCQEVGDKDCPALSRVFLASIASCSHSPDAQMALVSEVKSALQRALALPEGSVKHQRVQALSSIIVTMIESCPSPGQMPNQVFKGQQVMNNTMMKILVKKGVLVDLARIPHSLELSSPFLAATINAALKPLETLSRSVNSPDKFVSMKKGGSSGAGDHGHSADQGGTTTQVVTEPPQEQDGDNVVSVPSEMNVTIEDVTNDPEAQIDLESSGDQLISEPREEGQERELNDVLSQILRTGESDDPEDQVISEMTISRTPAEGDEENEILIDVEVEGEDEDFEPHDSQMVSQVLSEEEDDGDDRDHDGDHEDNQDDVSGDEEDYDEADQEEMGEDDDDEDEEDEDEEDEEGSDMDGDADDFQDIRNPFETDDLLFRMENYNTRGGGGQHIIFNEGLHTYQLPMHLHEPDTATDALPSIPAAPSNITSTHPLLMRQTELHSARGHRSTRQRLRTLPTVHVNLNSSTRQPNTPIILQRLLGPSTAAEILQLTSRLSTQNAGGPTRVLLASDELPIMQRTDNDLHVFDEIFSDPYSDASSSGTGVLSCIPSTLTRWTEETKVLEGDGVHDLVLVLKPPLIEELVRKRDEELAERREKRKKAAEAEAKKEKEAETEKGATTSATGATATASSEGATSNAGQAPEGETTSSSKASGSLVPATTTSSISSMSTAASTTTAGAQVTSTPATSAPFFNWSQLPMLSSLTPPEGRLLSDWLSTSGPSSTQESSVTSGQTAVSSVAGSGNSSTIGSLAGWTAGLPTPFAEPTSTQESSMTTGQAPVSSVAGTGSSNNTIGSLAGWTAGLPTPFSDLDQRAPRSTQGQASMISQLLDSFMMEQSLSMPTSSGVTSTAGQALPPAPLNLSLPPLRHSSPLSSTISSSQSSQPASTAQIHTPPTAIADSGFTLAPPASSLRIENPFENFWGTPAVQSRDSQGSSNAPLTSLRQGLTQDSLLNLVGFDSSSSSGVTGATPPLSQLGFMNSSSSPAASTTASSEPGIQSTTGTVAMPPTTDNTVATTTSSGTAGPGQTAGASSATAAQPQTEASTDSEIPEGVDPSFLAALPEHIRQEVVSEQLRLQRIRRRAQEQAAAPSSGASGEGSSALEVNPEFLAALPPAIQEEVLAQQRAEQARLAAQQESASNPDVPVDPATFFSSLSSTLRQQVLSDMDDSMLAVLPPELAAEAQELRRDMEERHRRLLQERLFAQAGGASISAILRQSGLAGRLGTRYAICATQRHNQWSFGGNRLHQVAGGSSNPGKVKGRFMLEPEALSCLLVLLFVDEPKLNTTRLHRVLRNLCYHGPTRAWLIRALLSILQKAGDSTAASSAAQSLCQEEQRPSGGFKDKGKGKKSSNIGGAFSSSSSSTSMTTNMSFSSSSSPTPSSSNDGSMQVDSGSQPLVTPASRSGSVPAGMGSGGGYWLSISLDAALGCRANVFQIHRTGGKKASSLSSPASVTIHPQAAPVVCRHALDTLISLAKIFPMYFLPAGKAMPAKCGAAAEGVVIKEDDGESASSKKPAAGGGATQTSPKLNRAAAEPASSKQDSKSADNDFWTILVRLDSASGKSKGKNVQRSHSSVGHESELCATDYPGSALGQLMSMLSHPVVRRSQLLTDRLLRLLGLISISLPDTAKPVASSTPVTSAAVSSSGVTSSRPTITMAPSVTAAAPVATTTTTASASVVSARNAPSITAGASNGSSTEEQTQAAPAPAEEEMKKETNGAAAEEEVEEEENPILYNELKLAVEVLTSKSCSEEGLEDATNLLLQLSWANNATRSAVLELLLSGARQLGMTVCGHINSLLEQLQELNRRAGPNPMEDESNSGGSKDGAEAAAGPMTPKGVLQDRFSGGNSVVVVSAPNKLKTGRELQLPSMSQLTSKTSGQQFFLRILKVIIQLRDAARSANAKNKKPNTRGRSGLEEFHSILSMIEGTRDSSARGQSGSASNALLMPGSSGPQEDMGDNLLQTGSSAQRGQETPMEVDSSLMSTDEAKPSGNQSSQSSGPPQLPRLSEQLGLEELWNTLGDCLAELARTPDHHAVLILQPAVEAFFIVHAGEKVKKSSEQPVSRREDQLAHLNMEMAPPSPSPGPSNLDASSLPVLGRDNSGIAMSSITHLPPDTQKFLKFAETHRTVLNQILRQSSFPLAEGPFSVLVDYTRILDFDVKRRYFRQELERMNEGARREDLPVHVRRSNVFEDSFRELFRRTPEEWKQRFYIVFEGEEGQDAGGLLREWYIIISHEIFNQNYALFLTSPGDRVTYSINPSSHCNSNHLSYFKFVGRIIAKAVYDNKLLDCYFTRSFYKHMLGLAVKYTDMESEDYAFYQGMVFLLENSVEDMGYDIFFSTEIQEFGVTETRELIPNGSNVLVTDENKREYVKLVCQMKMTGAIRQQLNAFLEGFYDIIPKKLVSIFTEQELELLISGLPTIDIDDLKANTEYHKYQATSLQIQWFWRALRSFDQAERANFLQFVTGTSKVPLGGFANLEGMNGTQKFQIHRDDRSTDRLPSAHTCFNQLDLPAYETYDKLRKMLLTAISECSEGFGLA